jgi:hypothetical protein
MIVRIINTEDSKVHEFSLLNSPYAGFAELIIGGCEEWIVDVSQIGINDTKEFSGLDDSFMAQGWVGAGNKILAYLQAKNSNQIRRLLDSSHNPGEILDQLVNS